MTARLAALCSIAAVAAAQLPDGLLDSERWSGSLDVRNRVVSDIGGSGQVYRSVVNLGEGPRLFDAELRFVDPATSFVDEANLDMSAWGGDPYNTARLSLAKREIYDFELNYRNLAYFNNLPSFANPLLEEGSLTSQRALDVTRRQLELNLELLPTRRITPYIGLYRADGFGNGMTTYASGRIENEFPIHTVLDDALTSLRGGVNLAGSRWNVVLEHGVASFTDDQRTFWNAGPNTGNRSGPLLGRQIVLERLTQQYRAEGSGVFSRAVIQAQPLAQLQFTGQFLFSQPKIDVSQQLQAEGDFVYLPELASYGTIVEQNLADANRPRSSASWNTEYRPFGRLRLVQSFYTDRLHVSSGSTLLQRLNAQPQLKLEDVQINTLVFNYSQHQVDAIFDAARWLSVRGGHRYVWGDGRVPPATLQFRPVARTTGEMRRHVWLTGAALKLWEGKLRVTTDLEGSPGDATFFRTGLQNYRKLRTRVRYRLSPDLHLSASFAVLDNRNDDPDIDLDFNSRQTSLSVQWSPRSSNRLTLLADYTRATLRSDISIVQPPFFGSAFSRYRDNGHHGTALADLALPREVRLRLGGAVSTNSGSRPTRYYTPQIELSAPMAPGVQVIADWRWYGFAGTILPIENFRAHTFSAGLRSGL